MRKVEVIVGPKENIPDLQGQSLKKLLQGFGYDEVVEVKVYKLIELNVNLENSKETRTRIRQACKKLLANSVIENYKISLKRKKNYQRRSNGKKS